jgi:hypothetical protein
MKSFEGARVAMTVALLLDATGAASSQEMESDLQVQPGVRNVDSTRDRTVVFPTAVSAPARRFSFTGIGAAIWEINYQFSDTLQAGAYTFLPVGVVGVFPQLNLRVPLAHGVAFGAGVLGGIGAPYGTGSDGFGALGMAHTELTFHNRDHMLTLTVAGGAGFYHEDLCLSPKLVLPAGGGRPHPAQGLRGGGAIGDRGVRPAGARRISLWRHRLRASLVRDLHPKFLAIHATGGSLLLAWLRPVTRPTTTVSSGRSATADPTQVCA